MLWIDWTFVAIVVLSMCLSLWRGFTHEAIALVGWVAAFILARIFHGVLADHLSHDIQPYDARRAIAWVAIFLLVLFIAHILGWLAHRFIAKTPLAIPDRVIGMGFGLLRGLAICAALIVVAKAFTTLPEHDWWRQAKLISPLQTVGDWFLDVWQQHATFVVK